MDAATMVAVSIAMDRSRDAAMEELMRQREIQAMHAADMAQKLYVQNLKMQQLQQLLQQQQDEVLDLQDGVRCQSSRRLAHGSP